MARTPKRASANTTSVNVGTPFVITQNVPAPPTWRQAGIRFSKKLFRRLLIWFLSLAVAFYIPVSEAGIPYPFGEWQSRIEHASKFPDVFLATVAMVVLSASDLADNIIARKSSQVGGANTASAWTIIVIYILFILYGMPAYSSASALAAQSYLPWGALLGLLAVGVVGEVLIATIPD